MIKKNIVAFVITFYPDEQLLSENLHSFYKNVDRIVVWDNTPNGSAITREIAIDYKAEYLTENENKGISYVLNKAWIYAKNHGYDYLLTMDQDSIWKNFERYINIVTAPGAPHGIYGPEVRMSKVCTTKTFEKTDFVITSGMLISIDILNQMNGYRSDFFVDGIDIEFCLRAKRNGIPTYRIRNCKMEQRFGTPQTVLILGIENHTTNYPWYRIKEIMKCHVLFLRHYPCSILLRKRIIMTYFWKQPLKILFLESNKKKKISAYLKGLWEGLRCQA
ncbi:MAG: glycosyltransferase [Prevotella sp.]|nr:glycosyltransferase [Prevotella sp.]